MSSKTTKFRKIHAAPFCFEDGYGVFGHEDNTMGTVHLLAQYKTSAAAERKAHALRTRQGLTAAN